MWECRAQQVVFPLVVEMGAQGLPAVREVLPSPTVSPQGGED